MVTGKCRYCRNRGGYYRSNTYHSASGKDSTVAMTNTSGDTYEFTLPAFPNFSAVSFHLEAKDSNGLTGRAPLSGGFNFFVQMSLLLH